MPDGWPADVSAPAVASATPTVTGTDVVSLPLLAPLVFGIALAIALLGAGLGATPPWALEWPVVAFVYERRDALFFAGLGIALGLVVALAVTVWSA